ncbi:MAG: PKD domain-containing protein [Flavobacteriales bacterium]|nr:PKD domain-containing protein [Flavobacteriales bacterium]
MKHILRVLPFLVCTTLAQAQTTYTHTLPTIQGSQLNSWVDFSFPNTTANTAGGTLEFGWLACWQQVFGGSSKIWIELETAPDTYTQVYYETGNVSECVTFNRTANISMSVLANAIATGGGSVNGHVRVQDSCYPGVGCSFFNDPVVSGLTLEYLAHAANFTSNDASFCPGGSVQFTDASLGTVSSYAWYFEGGVPTTSTEPNPLVQYPTAGTWDVVLSVVNEDGPDEIMLSNYVTVYNLPLANAGIDEDVCIGTSHQLQASGGANYQWSPSTGLNNGAIANPIAAPIETTTYTVLVTDANGCQAEDEVTLTVHELPTVIAAAGDNTLCPGDTANIIAEGAQIYSWSPNLFISSNSGASVEAWPPSDFTWTVFGTDAFGCSHDTTVTIDVLAPPPTPTATNTGMTVMSTAAVGYQWYLDGAVIPGATGQEWAPLMNGNYSVVITDANGCMSESLPVYFGTVGLVDAAAATFRIYPQPADDELTITDVKAGSTLRLFDAAGRVVSVVNANNAGLVRMDVRTLTPGSYLLEVREGHSSQRLPVLVR